MELQILDFISDNGTTKPQQLMKEFNIREKKEINSILHKLVLAGKLTRIEEENGGNPRYIIRLKGEAAKRVETEDDEGVKAHVSRDQILQAFSGDDTERRSRDLAKEILGNDKKDSIRAINSTIYGLVRDKILRRIEDDEVHYGLVE